MQPAGWRLYIQEIKASHSQLRRYRCDALFFVNIDSGLKKCPSNLDSTAVRVAVRHVRETPVFYGTHKKCPSARCVKLASLTCCDVDMFKITNCSFTTNFKTIDSNWSQIACRLLCENLVRI
jgi:hypothetical protein